MALFDRQNRKLLEEYNIEIKKICGYGKGYNTKYAYRRHTDDEHYLQLFNFERMLPTQDTDPSLLYLYTNNQECPDLIQQSTAIECLQTMTEFKGINNE